MASTYLSRTQSTSPTSADIGTISIWFKRSDLGTTHRLIHAYSDSTNFCQILIASDGKMTIKQKVSDVNVINLITNQVFRDPSAWYHIVLEVDTTQGTSSNRVKLYVNGSQVTSFSTETYDGQNNDFSLFNKANLQIGWDNTNSKFSGSMAHVHYIDGTAYAASTFGETDATTGIWKPKTAPSVTYGTNGFFLKFENSGAFGTDSSGNGNNFTVNGTMTQNIDTPSNVFATFNSLWIQRANNVQPAFSNANLTAIFNNAGTNEQGVSTLAASSGKYYAEIKWDNATANTATNTGIFPVDYFGGDPFPSAYIYLADGTIRSKNSASSYGNSYTTGDIIGIALDLDNNKLYFSKNGVWQNSGDPTSGATGTGAISIIADTYYMYCSDYASSGNRQASANFGNGYFGTTAVSSAQNPDDGIGIFEYDVPAGYRALCTKSINAQEYS